MSRRVSLPGAAELFRVTGPEPEVEATGTAADPAAVRGRPAPGTEAPTSTGRGSASLEAVRDADDEPAYGATPSLNSGAVGGRSSQSKVEDEPDDSLADDEEWPARRPVRRRRSALDRRPTGRERHDEKITVYVSAEELIDLEHARLTLRGEFGLAVDRGRIVREAVAVVLADLDAKGESSILVRRLRGR